MLNFYKAIRLLLLQFLFQEILAISVNGQLNVALKNLVNLRKEKHITENDISNDKS